jgi:hypothetical protein
VHGVHPLLCSLVRPSATCGRRTFREHPGCRKTRTRMQLGGVRCTGRSRIPTDSRFVSSGEVEQDQTDGSAPKTPSGGCPAQAADSAMILVAGVTARSTSKKSATAENASPLRHQAHPHHKVAPVLVKANSVRLLATLGDRDIISAAAPSRNRF